MSFHQESEPEEAPHGQGFFYNIEDSEIEESATLKAEATLEQPDGRKRPRNTLSFTCSEPPTTFRRPLALHRVDELHRIQAPPEASASSASSGELTSFVEPARDFVRDCFAGAHAETQLELAPAFTNLLQSVCAVYESLHPGKRVDYKALCEFFL